MTWEHRQSSGKYFYRKVWRNGRCHSVYYGSGDLGERAASEFAEERQKRDKARKVRRAVVAQQRRMGKEVEIFHRLVRAAVSEILEPVAYQHRGQWRIRGHRMTTDMMVPATGPGLMAQVAVLSLLDAASMNARSRLAVLQEMERLRAQMGYAEATRVEQLLIEDVTVAWLAHHLTQKLHSQNARANGDYDLKVLEHFERRLSASHRRYLQALETLARVRRLEVMIQINIAEQQLIQR